MLDRIGRKQDGVVSGANTANRKRMVFGKAMDYACEIGAMPSSPLKRIKWTKPRTLRAVPGRGHQQHQARQFLAAVGRQGLDRLLELLLIVVLRAWFARPGNGAPGWYRTY